MKLSKIIAAAAILLTMSSCSVLGSLSGNNQSASLTNGIKVGTSLLNLYNQYKSTGTINMTNLSSINDVANLVSGIKNIKDNTNTETSLADYAQGLINGSSNLVNTNNAANIISGLTSLSNTDLSGTSNAASILATQATTNLAKNAFMSKVFGNVSNDGNNLTNAVSGITSILGLLK